jgi:hypothetical protein
MMEPQNISQVSTLTLKYRKRQKSRLNMLSPDRISPNRSYTLAGLNTSSCHPRTKSANVVKYAKTPFACEVRGSCFKHHSIDMLQGTVSNR